MSNSSADAIAAFLAKGGKVTKLDPDASNGVTDRQWYAASKGDIDLRSRLNGSDAERLAERKMEIGREVRHLGGSQAEALDAASDFEARWTHRHGGGMDF
jgi:hypothetical protein